MLVMLKLRVTCSSNVRTCDIVRVPKGCAGQDVSDENDGMKASTPSLLVLAALLLIGGAGTAVAQDIGQTGAGGSPTTSVTAPETSGQPSENAPAQTPSIQSSLGKYGDPGGIRAFLDSKGIDYSFTYIGEVLGNATGGIKRGATYEGEINGALDIDLGKLAGLKDAALHANVYQLNGRGLSGNNTLDLFTVSGIEAFPSTRLYEAWFEQKLAGGKLFVRVGQIAADTEFVISQTASLFIGSTFGFPSSLTADLPSGGPDFPLATPGVRVKATPTDNVTLLAALFDGDPAGPYRPGVNSILPQLRNPSGTNFRLVDPPLLMTEAQFAYNQEKDAKGLPGTVKVGYLHHFEDFAATDIPDIFHAVHHGNDGLYGIIDQTIYRQPGNDQIGAAVFLRGLSLPSDRNLIDLYIDGGISYQGLIPGRVFDTIGVSAAYARISPNVTTFDAATGSPLVRDYQALIEATYQYVVVPGFTMQPVFQYIFHPGAHGVADPQTGQPIRDAAVFGLRVSVRY